MASSTQDLIPYLQLADTFGALFIGVVLAAVLFGVTNVQVFIYFHSHSGTGVTFYKLVVIWFWIFDALHLALTVHYIYFYLVINYASIGGFTVVVWSFKLQLIVSVLIIFGEHLLYVHRISIVSRGRSRALPIMVGIAVLLAAGVAIAIVWRAYQEVHVITDLVKIQWTVYMFLGTVAFVDILIASSIWYLLATSRTGFSRTDLFITKLMSYIINTGCLTSICSMIVIITCAVMPKNYIFEAVGFLLIKLYVNSYIALLNARYYVQANTDMFKYPDDEVLHITRPIQAVMPQRPIEVTMEMSSLSSA